MKSKPILMSVPMIRALLAGSKSQTRRVVKNPDHYGCLTGDCPHGMKVDCDRAMVEHCPYGKPGDLLWVLETWASEKDVDDCGITPESDRCLFFRADQTGICAQPDHKGLHEPGRWRPSIFMPRWASRLTLRITEVRVQRLQDISEANAKAEGLGAITKDGKLVKYGIPDADGLPGTDNTGWAWTDWRANPVDAYARLWTQINGPESWADNPWVWCLSFDVIHANVDQVLAEASP